MVCAWGTQSHDPTDWTCFDTVCLLHPDLTSDIDANWMALAETLLDILRGCISSQKQLTG